MTELPGSFYRLVSTISHRFVNRSIRIETRNNPFWLKHDEIDTRSIASITLHELDPMPGSATRAASKLHISDYSETVGPLASIRRGSRVDKSIPWLTCLAYAYFKE